MITLYTFGPAFGLTDPSPFVTKAEVLLKMAGLPYRTDTKGLSKAPKGKLPYIRDGGDIIANSSFIRRHLEKRYTIDFDKGLSQHERGVACAVEKCARTIYIGCWCATAGPTMRTSSVVPPSSSRWCLHRSGPS